VQEGEEMDLLHKTIVRIPGEVALWAFSLPVGRSACQKAVNQLDNPKQYLRKEGT
jgi:hypothetical protein